MTLTTFAMSSKPQELKLSGFFLVGCLMLSVGSVVLNGKDMKAADFFDSVPQRALAEASAKGRIEKIKQLLTQGAQVNFQGREGMTPLIWSLLHENKEAYQYLLENGANPNLLITESALTSDGLIDGNSAMSLAAMHEDPWYLEVTLKHGGNPNIFNPIKGKTPIHQCIMLLDASHPRSRIEQLKMLIASGADLESRNKDDLTPLMHAVRLNRYDMAFVLLQAGADPAQRTKWGTTVAYHIKQTRIDPKSELVQWREKVIGLLKAKGIDLNQN